MLRSYPVREHYKNNNARLLVMQKRPRPVSLLELDYHYDFGCGHFDHSSADRICPRIWR
jgi:hypothetical protein